MFFFGVLYKHLNNISMDNWLSKGQYKCNIMCQNNVCLIVGISRMLPSLFKHVHANQRNTYTYTILFPESF